MRAFFSLTAIEGRAHSHELLRAAITAATSDSAPSEVLVKRHDHYQTLRIDHHDGLQYPHLGRIADVPDRQADILKART